MPFASTASRSAGRSSDVIDSVIEFPLVRAWGQTDQAVQRREGHRRLLGLAGSGATAKSRATPAKCRNRNRSSAEGEGWTKLHPSTHTDSTPMALIAHIASGIASVGLNAMNL